MTNEMKKEALMKAKENKIKAMRSNPLVVDDHTGKAERITGLVEFVNPNKPLGCCFDARYYSVNACMMEDGVLHCSQMSIGGVLWGAYPDSKQLKEYNDACIQEGGKIKCIHRPDGTTVKPEGEEMSPLARYFTKLIEEERRG